MFMLAGRVSVSPACLDVFPVNSLVHEGKAQWKLEVYALTVRIRPQFANVNAPGVKICLIWCCKTAGGSRIILTSTHS